MKIFYISYTETEFVLHSFGFFTSLSVPALNVQTVVLLFMTFVQGLVMSHRRYMQQVFIWGVRG